jgi:hypothetical protein
VIPNALLRRKLRRVLRVRAGGDEDTTTWTPLRITNVNGYIDPRLDTVLGADGRLLSILEQVRGEEMQMTYTNPDGVGGLPVGEANRWRPRRIGSLFGSGLVGLRMDPLDSHPRATYLRLDEPRPLPNGLSWLWVSKHTSTKTVRGHSQNCPLTVVSESSVDTFSGAGFNGGALAYHYFEGGWQEQHFGADYNDGVARLYAFTHATNGELKAYVNGVQVGATSSALYFEVWQSWCAIGTGYRAEPPVDPYGGDDGFEGDLGPVVIVDGVIADHDHARLYQWCQEEGWCA